VHDCMLHRRRKGFARYAVDVHNNVLGAAHILRFDLPLHIACLGNSRQRRSCHQSGAQYYCLSDTGHGLDPSQEAAAINNSVVDGCSPKPPDKSNVYRHIALRLCLVLIHRCSCGCLRRLMRYFDTVKLTFDTPAPTVTACVPGLVSSPQVLSVYWPAGTFLIVKLPSLSVRPK